MWCVRCLLSPILGPLFGITILITSLFGAYIITLFLPLVFLNQHRLWRSLMDRAISFWMIIPVTFLEYGFGTEFTVSGDQIEGDKPALVIMNHRTRLDWMYFWGAIFKVNPWLLTSSKISLKSQLKMLPGCGFGMAASQFIFLERNIELDKGRFDEAVDYYVDMGNNYQILLFPEGTDKSPWTTSKSVEYAKKNGLKQLKHVIYPRTAGLAFLINKMRDCEYINCIYDVTVAYPKNMVQSEIELILKGNAPEKVHFDVKRIEISSVPRSDNDISKWINDLWIEKDEKLETYYAVATKQRSFCKHGEQFIWEEKDEPLHKIVKLFSYWFWIVVITVWLYHLTFLRLVQVGASYFLVMFAITQFVYGGIDRMVYYRWRKSVEYDMLS